MSIQSKAHFKDLGRDTTYWKARGRHNYVLPLVLLSAETLYDFLYEWNIYNILK